ncbi:vacuolar ATPase assembly integral membrane protein vma21 [Blastocladiella emersonii ATCC 22665]|nr:vacuolar ATPase assembly integral membrane protein vma21 [Blastocladiella emersonii ATCC 22665]
MPSPKKAPSTAVSATTTATPAPAPATEVKKRSIFAKKDILPPRREMPPAKPFEITINVIVKFIVFSILLVVVPLWTYYKSLADWFKDDTSVSALAAVAAANLVVLLYVVVAVFEGDTDGSFPKPKDDDKAIPAKTADDVAAALAGTDGSDTTKAEEPKKTK